MPSIETVIDLDKVPDPKDKEEKPDIEIEEGPAEAASPTEKKTEEKPKAEEPPGWDEDKLRKWASEKLRKRIDQLTYEKHEARREAQSYGEQLNESVRVARVLAEDRHRLASALAEGGKALKSESEAKANAAIQAAKVSWKAAYEAGDADRIAQAQQDLASATVELEKAKMMRPPPAPEPFQPQQWQQPQPQPQVARPSSAVLTWAEKNPWFHGDEPLSRDMTAQAHVIDERLAEEGIRENHPDYFKRIDEGMRQRFPEYFQGKEQREPPATAAPNVVAPATRTRNQAPRTVRLTESQLAIARRLNVDPRDYAREFLKLNEST